ncbi:MAG TPA: TonB family protein [Gammaproteobacteria bacterium]|nr:TonB family protein [Gammaproteobacteria bacterium]
MRWYLYQAAFILACALSACSSAPRQGNVPRFVYPGTQAYWLNPYWQAELFQAVQCVAYLPDNETNRTASGIQGTVRFTYDKGVITNPAIFKSTGNPDLDKLLLQQVVTAKVPKPFGLNTDQPHEFELLIEMFTPYESFRCNVYAAIKQKPEYPRDAFLRGKTGIATVAFDYLDGKVSNLVVVSTSGHNDLDQASLNTVSNAVLPAPPAGYAGKTLQMQAIFCYDINFTKKCPIGANVIDVEGTRIKRTTVYW